MAGVVTKAVMLIAAAAVLFALVVPLAATPMPVGAVKRISDAVAPSAVPLLTTAASVFEAAPAVLPEAAVPAPADFSDLNCVRNC